MIKKHPILSLLPYHTDFLSFRNALTSHPPSPEEIRSYSENDRRNFLLPRINDWFYFGADQFKVAERIQQLIIERYQAINYESPEDVRSFYSSGLGPTLVGAIIGNAGAGKSETVGRCLLQYPQIVEVSHSHFMNKVPTVVWFSHSIQSTEKKPFAQELANAWNELLSKKYPDSNPEIPTDIIEKGSGDAILNAFENSAKKHYLGVLHIDEFNNLFSPVAERSSDKKNIDVNVVDDKTLRKLLSILNSRSFATLISGTPEGAEGFNRRVSTAQRIGTRQISMNPLKLGEYFEHFLNELWQYQFTDIPIPLSKEIISLVYLKTAGNQRLILDGFRIAQENVLKMNKPSLSYDDLKDAFDSFSHELKMIVRAVINNDETLLARKTDYRTKF